MSERSPMTMAFAVTRPRPSAADPKWAQTPRLSQALWNEPGGAELKPLLNMVPATATYGELLHRWSRTIPAEQAAKMLAFLCTNEVLC